MVVGLEFGDCVVCFIYWWLGCVVLSRIGGWGLMVAIIVVYVAGGFGCVGRWVVNCVVLIVL